MATDKPREPSPGEPLTKNGIKLMVTEAVREHMELATKADLRDVQRHLEQRFQDLKDLVYKVFLPLLAVLAAALITALFR